MMPMGQRHHRSVRNAVVCVRTIARLALLLIGGVANAFGDTTIDPTNAYSYGANIGFMNWRGDGANGIVIGRYICSGSIYGANVGWMSLGDGTAANGIQYANSSADDFGVNTVKDPNVSSELYLRGYAYGANIGWINFENTGNARVMLSNGRLRGFAWSANVGWINLDDLNVFVQTDTIDPGADTDGDGLPDAYEYIYFGNLDMNGGGDADGDGEDNLSEFRAGTVPTDPNSVYRSARSLNIATRLRVLTGDDVLIAGFAVSGSDPKNVLIRGLGNSIDAPGTLADPTLELFDPDGNSIAFNNNWRDTQRSEIEATTIPPTRDEESAIVRVLAPGLYTAVLAGNGGSTGLGLVEAYDLASGQPTRLANISTRGSVTSGDNVMIGGFIVGAGLGVNGNGSARYIVRAIGPSLASDGVAGAMQDPFLEIHNGNGDLIAANNDWRDAQQSEIEGTGIPPQDNRESAVVGVVNAGAYTAIVRGADGSGGVALVEIYNLP